MKSELLIRIVSLLERIDSALVVREPGNARSVEAFDGLRKSILQSSKNRRMHVSHLLSLSDSIERGADYQLIKDRVADFMLELGVSRSTDVGRSDFFDVTGGEGDYLECVVPAVIETLDDGSMSLVRLGEAIRTSVPSSNGVMVQKEHKNDDALTEVETTRGMKVAIGITIAIVGFFFGWVIASTVQDDSEAGTSSQPRASQEFNAGVNYNVDVYELGDSTWVL